VSLRTRGGGKVPRHRVLPVSGRPLPPQRGTPVRRARATDQPRRPAAYDNGAYCVIIDTRLLAHEYFGLEWKLWRHFYLKKEQVGSRRCTWQVQL